MRLSWWIVALVPACVVVAGCESSVPSFPPPGRDAGYECGETDGGSIACPSGEVCLQGFCYAQCSAERPCGPREECSPQGVCVFSTTDAGPPPVPDPCDTAGCAAPTPFCRAGACLQCLEATGICPAGAPVCDLARGTCAPFNPAALCAACNIDADCTSIDASLRCTTRAHPAPTERVCAPTCEGGVECPSWLVCDPASLRCLPRFNSSCTGLRAALDGAACGSDADCAPVAATPTDGLFVGTCFDDGRGVATCHVPCGTDGDCPSGSCLSGFCR